jgi:pimeloyl-ACP methyl ester carboxylesterase/DNA-binding CsgD family transcriptional regulator
MDAPPVQYVKTSDGYNIAYSVSGEGRPAVFVPPVFHHLQLRWGDLTRGLSLRFKLVRFDSRGTGLSSRGLSNEYEMPHLVRDLEAVVDRVGLNKMVLIGVGSSCHTAVRYAVKYPERVEGLILISCSVSLGHSEPVLFKQQASGEWDAFLYVMAQAGRSREETLAVVEDLKKMVDAEDFVTIVRFEKPPSIAVELEQLRTPTLVIHPSQVRTPSAEDCAEVTSKIVGARMVVSKGGGGMNAVGDAESDLAAIDEFLTDLPALTDAIPMSGATPQNDLSQRELEVLRLLAQGRSNPEIAKELFITRNTVQNHVGSILTKTNLNNRAQAAVYAQQHGIV